MQLPIMKHSLLHQFFTISFNLLMPGGNKKVLFKYV